MAIRWRALVRARSNTTAIGFPHTGHDVCMVEAAAMSVSLEAQVKDGVDQSGKP